MFISTSNLKLANLGHWAGKMKCSLKHFLTKVTFELKYHFFFNLFLVGTMSDHLRFESHSLSVHILYFITIDKAKAA